MNPVSLVSKIVFILLLCAVSVHAQGNAFTYQGRLTDNGSAYTGSAEFQATLWDVSSGGTMLAINSPSSVVVGVTNGLFILPLDFGANFPGADRWLQLEVRTAIGPFTTLTPRQQITPAPYAIAANSLVGTLPVGQLSGTLGDSHLSGNVPRLDASQTFTGTQSFDPASGAPFTVGNSTLVANLNADLFDGLDSSDFWKSAGNAGTTAGTHFLGTTDNQSIEFKVNNVRALRLEPNASGAPNVIGGSPNNSVGAGVVGATIGGGGAVNYYLGQQSFTNRVDANFSTIGGGMMNTISAESASISGGSNNQIDTNAPSATIGGGLQNTIQANAQYSTIGGGSLNTIQTNGAHSTIGGGFFNKIESLASYATIGGGYDNMMQTNALFATIGGGSTKQDSGPWQLLDHTRWTR